VFATPRPPPCKLPLVNLRRIHLVGCLFALGALTACGGIGLGSVTVGEPSFDVADAGLSTETGSASHSNSADAGARYDAVAPQVNAPAESPLCHVDTGYGCDPDQAACLFDDLADGGGLCEPAKDCEGTTTATQAAACRVTRNDMTEKLQASCEGIGQAGEGAACSQSNECAAELDCVGATTGSSGVCRRYCCTGSCSGTDSFCDIEPVLNTGTLIPVCTSGPPCTLLGNGCPTGEYCTVVNAGMGQTACVVPGTETVGADCTAGKCGKDLACIENTCKALCDVHDATSCPSGQVCMPLLAFGENVGVCATTK